MPNYSKTIVCLANSRKTSGRCVAGKVVQGEVLGEWVRPVSGRESGEVSEDERHYQDGQDPAVLDIVRIPLVRPAPHGFQRENHLIDSGYYWHKVGVLLPADLVTLIDPVAPLWDNSDSSYNGIHDRVSEAMATAAGGSLRFVDVPNLRVTVGVEGAEFGNAKRKVRGDFTYAGTLHRFSITDPVTSRQYLAGEDGAFDIGRKLLCVSLGDLYQGSAYKLIAGVIHPA